MRCIAAGWKKSSASLSVSLLTEVVIGRVSLQQLVGTLSHTWHAMVHYMRLVKYVDIYVDQMQLRW